MKKTLHAIKALAAGHRLLALIALEKQELCLCDLQDFLGIAASSVSRHISILQKAGFVISRKEGKWTYFRLVPTFGESIPSTLLRAVLASMEHCDSLEKYREDLREQLEKKDKDRCR